MTTELRDSKGELVTEHFRCIATGCGSRVDVPVQVTPANRRCGHGWWVAPPTGWLQLVDQTHGMHGLFACSFECADGYYREWEGP